jgi:hypothetical protein
MMLKYLNQRQNQRMLLVASLVSYTFLTSLLAHANNKTSAPANDRANQGWPSRRVGGGSRPACPQSPCPGPPIALVPDGLLVTASQLPTLLFYLPKIQSPTHVRIEFVLRDENDRLVYERLLTSPGEAGIIALNLSSSATFAGLATDKPYNWYLSIIYDSLDRSRDDVVEGWVKRVPLSETISRQLDHLSPIEQVKLYEKEQLLPEALSKLAELKRFSPEDQQLSQLWQDLISSLKFSNADDKNFRDKPVFVSRSVPEDSDRPPTRDR